jgi:hypothetical protein
MLISTAFGDFFRGGGYAPVCLSHRADFIQLLFEVPHGPGDAP